MLFCWKQIFILLSQWLNVTSCLSVKPLGGIKLIVLCSFGEHTKLMSCIRLPDFLNIFFFLYIYYFFMALVLPVVRDKSQLTLFRSD